ncbi:MAG: hypothetical protein FWC89_11955, partial [Defluviitaleaceae bacterium]|nr:hypothetical protein [Defluviitaleaceae bacterium]
MKFNFWKGRVLAGFLALTMVMAMFSPIVVLADGDYYYPETAYEYYEDEAPFILPIVPLAASIEALSGIQVWSLAGMLGTVAVGSTFNANAQIWGAGATMTVHEHNGLHGLTVARTASWAG